jgi:ankyrin repeat protein
VYNVHIEDFERRTNTRSQELYIIYERNMYVTVSHAACREREMKRRKEREKSTNVKRSKCDDDSDNTECTMGGGSVVDGMKEMKEFREMLDDARGLEPDVVQLLLDAGSDVNQTYDGRISLLQIACQSGIFETVKLLVLNGADVNHLDEQKNTPLHVACQEGYVEIVRVLIENDANVNACNEDNATPLHFVFQNAEDDIFSAQKAHVDLVKTLIEQGGAKLNVMDEPERWTPLHFAADQNLVDVATLLIQNKARVNISNKYKRMPLHIAAEKGNVDVARVLLQNKAQVNAEMNMRMTAFHLAALEGHYNFAMLLVEYVFSLLLAIFSFTHTHTHIRHGADVNKVTEENSTALHMACQSGNLEFAKFLIRKGLDVNAVDKFGVTVLDEAAGVDNTDILKLLYDNGAKKEK